MSRYDCMKLLIRICQKFFMLIFVIFIKAYPASFIFTFLAVLFFLESVRKNFTANSFGATLNELPIIGCETCSEFYP